MFKSHLFILQVNYLFISSAYFSIWFPSPPISIVLYICNLSPFSHVRLFATLWTVAHQGPLSMGFSGQEHWSGLRFLLQGIFLSQGSNLGLLHCRYSLLMSHWESPYIKDVNPLFLKYFANVFSHFVICVLIMLKLGSFVGLFVCHANSVHVKVISFM